MSTVTKEFGGGGGTLGLGNLIVFAVLAVAWLGGAVLLCAKSCAHLAGHLDFSAKLLTLSKGNIQSHMICGVDPIWEFSWRAPQVSSAFGYFRSC
jgi:hypothetical protein